MKETDVYEQVAQYLNLQYPNVIYHFDLSGVWTPSHKVRNLYGKINKRAWPDLFIAAPMVDRQITDHKRDSYGLFIEVKKDGSSPYLKDGKTLKKDDHVAEQAMMLKALESQGYKAVFATGFDEVKAVIDEYLGKPTENQQHTF